MAIPEVKRSVGGGEAAPARRPAAGLWPPPRDAWIAAAGVALIYAGHLFYGALSNDAAMSMNIVAAMLVGAMLLIPRLRDDVFRLKGLAWPAGLLALVILVALWTLTPWTPGGPHPVWAYVGISPGAATIDKSATLMEIIKLLGLACLFMLGAAAGARDDRARFAVQLTVFAGALFGIWVLVGAASGLIVQPTRRLEAYFLNANTAGLVFAILLSLSTVQLLARVRSWRSSRQSPAPLLLEGSVTLTLAVCLLNTASRGAVVAFLLGLAGLVALQIRARRLTLTRAWIGTLVAIALAAMLVLIAGDLILARFFDSPEDSLNRVDVWRAHWRAFLVSPIVGYGLGGAETVNKSLLARDNYAALWSIRAPLSVYVQWLEETGLLGASAMFLTIGSVLLRAIRGHSQRSRMTGLLAGLLAADLVVLVEGAMDFGLEVFSVAAFWAWLLGVQFSLAQGSSRR